MSKLGTEDEAEHLLELLELSIVMLTQHLTTFIDAMQYHKHLEI